MIIRLKYKFPIHRDLTTDDIKEIAYYILDQQEGIYPSFPENIPVFSFKVSMREAFGRRLSLYEFESGKISIHTHNELLRISCHTYHIKPWIFIIPAIILFNIISFPIWLSVLVILLFGGFTIIRQWSTSAALADKVAQAVHAANKNHAETCRKIRLKNSIEI